uniref:Flagellar protein FliL n=1 Tax=Treponema phagedenis TaxID=162 RepID=Q56333_TREPH|nr:FliL [Treponema phagedenis]
MADNEKIGGITDELDEHLTTPPVKKAGFLPILLKWIVVVLAAVIFIVTVVVITANFMSRRGANHTAYPVSEEYQRDTRELLQFYDMGIIRTNSADTIPAPIVVNVAIGYPMNDKATQQELSGRVIELKDFLRSFFQKKTAAELRQEQKIKIEIRNEINDNILSKTKIKDIRFTQYDILEP